MSEPEQPMPSVEVERPASQPAPQPPCNSAAFSLRAPPLRVMRLSRRAMAIGGVALGSVIGGSLIYGLSPHRPAETPQNLYSGDGATKAEAVTAAPADYSEVPKLGQPLPGDLGRSILNAQGNAALAPAPAMGPPEAGVTAAQQAHERLAQERDSARTSRLFLGADGATSGQQQALASPATPPLDAAASTTGPAVQSTDGAGSATSGKRAFLKVAGDRPTESTARITSPSSPYVVMAGSIIPAALITGIRSDLPGQITAQVTQNVYDSPTGRTLLIPQGARLVGEYDSAVSAGQNRVLLAWDRLIFPDGRSILLNRQPGADGAGYAGLQDRTNYHWGSMVKAALVSTLLGVGTQLTTQGDDALTRALRYGTQDTINQTGRQVVQRQLDIPPTLTIRPGYALRVIVTRDLILEPVGGRP